VNNFLRRIAMVSGLTGLAACTGDTDKAAVDSTKALTQAPAARTDTARVAETWISALDTGANVDGPTVYFGSDGAPWIIASAKTANVLIVLDAHTGKELRRVSGPGTGEGKLSRPNGVLVIGDSLLLVVERDNHRVQGFRLPSFAPAGVFGADRLRKPYGLAALPDTAGGWMVYVTDNYETADEQVPALRDLGARVKQYRVALRNGRLSATHVRDFGDTTSAGAIRVTESIFADPDQDRLLLAEELETDSHIKVYSRDGRFTGTVFGRGYFPQQAEGIALYRCGADAGYWVTTDQGATVNTFHLFDRNTFAHVASFAGPVTNTTDGVALTQRGFGAFPHGAFLAAHADAAVAAFSWDAIAKATGTKGDCAAQ
jgi:3-phytase